jgi:hypothetical protein
LTTGGGVGADGESLHAASRLAPQTTNNRSVVRAGQVNRIANIAKIANIANSRKKDRAATGRRTF